MKSVEEYLRNTEVTETGCWLWQGALSSDGYARVGKRNGNGKLHRIVYEHFNPGKSLDGLVVRHTCDTPKCVNPAHLVSGTVLENIKDRNARGRTYHHVKADMYKEVHALRGEGMKLREVAQETGLGYKQVEYILYFMKSPEGAGG